MQTASRERAIESPEKLISGLVSHLRNHALSDSLLICLPPLLAFSYLAAYLYHAAAVDQWSLGIMSLGVAATLVGAAVLFYRPLVPSRLSAAAMLDDLAGAKDRFVTLASIDPAGYSPLLVNRLREETADLSKRIEMRREFPYRVKPSFYRSLLGSLVAAVLLHFLLPAVQSSVTPLAMQQRIRELARQFAERPRLSEVARRLESLAKQFTDPKVSPAEQQASIQEVRKKIEEQQKNEPAKDERDLLGKASGILKGLEKQSGDGQDQRENQANGGGGIQSNLPQEGQGESKQGQGSDGENKGDLNAQTNKEMKQGQSARGDAAGESSEKNQQTKGDDKSRQGDPNKPDGEKSKETAGKKEGQSQEPGGKSKASEETPKGTPPSDRLAGQGQGPIKDARYVTVQLPDQPATDAKGSSNLTKEAKGGKSRTTLPVSNVPLPAHVPDAPTEVQQMPLEYRGMIR